jgi:hypothetical protein
MSEEAGPFRCPASAIAVGPFAWLRCQMRDQAMPGLRSLRFDEHGHGIEMRVLERGFDRADAVLDLRGVQIVVELLINPVSGC